MMRLLRRLLIGRPLHNQEMIHEKLTKKKALAIFSSDALSSVAYGPEQIMIILAASQVMAYGYLGPVAIAILILLAVVTISYVQVGRANPGGGGSYSVAIKNLGELPALTAAAALFADYTLTVAVSVSAGTAALISAFPDLLPFEVTIDLAILFGILMLINLRGVRESSTAFVFPTYCFIFGILTLLLSGFYQALTQQAPVIPPESLTRQWDWTMAFLILRAFANGCSSMTGIEAISNGVPMFKEPEVRNATITTVWMSGILGFMFIGISFLIMHFHILPLEGVTALSQLTEDVFGRNWLYYYIQITTMAILYLAANTSFNGLPPLLSILARDGYMPRYLGVRGERLNFSNGIILLSVVAGLLIIAFNGDTEHLISLYAIGVFLSFTIAQTGMVIHWHREHDNYWLLRASINAIGAAVTGVVVLIIGITKFFYGAWLVLFFIPIMISLFKKIHSHYDDMAEQLHLPMEELNPAIAAKIFAGKNLVIVPIASPTSVVAHTLKYAKSISDEVIALHIATDEEAGNRVQEKWKCWNPGIQLVTLYSPYRLVIQPLIDYVGELAEKKAPNDYITVLIPEFETKKWWHRLLHNQTGWILRTLLILKENVIVTTIPFHLKK
ncbi:putative membrane protein [Propionispora sp. 2/2-37]|uniref:APC family permease n=1 Tax=Propionispora sp. 2/2-37 TaxID=1677858 RepID=UPI0006BB7C7A|nr:amino acid permease [Propionispora sp. 2/2-37]CUH93954.1 putative membrane protein [Propionispora sp. 2/2-37]